MKRCLVSFMAVLLIFTAIFTGFANATEIPDAMVLDNLGELPVPDKARDVTKNGEEDIPDAMVLDDLGELPVPDKARDEVENGEENIPDTIKEGELANEELGIMPISLEVESYDSTTNTINDDLYLMTSDVVLTQNVDGNVYVMGDNVKFEDVNIFGNVYVMAEKLEISSNITGSMYVMASDFKFNGVVQDAYVMAGKAEFSENSLIQRSAKVVTDEMNLKGAINRNLICYANDVNVSNGVSVLGKISYSGNLNADSGAIISQTEKLESNFNEIQSNAQETMKVLGDIIKMLSVITGVITAIVIMAIILIFTSKDDIKKNKKEIKEYIIDLLKGFGYIVCIPIISIILILTIVGIPLGILVLTIYIVTIILGTIVGCLEIGKKITAYLKSNNRVIALLISILVYILVVAILSEIPYVGSLIKFLITLYGFRIIIKYFFRKDKKVKEKEVIQENA